MQDGYSCSSALQSALLANAKLIQMPEGAVLFRRGEPSFGVFLLCKGRISLRLEATGGSVVVDRTVASGGIVGLPAVLGRRNYSLTAMTIEPSELALIESGALMRTMQSDPRFGLEIVATLGEEVSRMRDILAEAC